MKRILYIAPHSFPVSSSESICNSKIAYTLADMGYKVDVFSCSDSYHYPENGSLDAILSGNKNLRLFKVKKYPSITRRGSIKANIVSLFRHIRGFIKTGYVYNGALLPYEIIRRVIEVNGGQQQLPYDLMITRGYRTDVAGIYLKKHYGLYWIANWNDPYTEEKFPSPYGKGYAAKLNIFKKKVFEDVQKYADFHTFPSERLRDYMLKCFTRVVKENTLIIPHMAMNLLFTAKKEISERALTMVHCGNVRKPRDPSNFLKALSLLKRQGLIGSRELIVRFIGMYDSQLPSLVSSLNIEEEVELLGSMSYADCQKEISNCTVSLIIEAICEEGIYLPTKFVDALQVSTPVFCVSPPKGTLRDLVEKYGVGYSCNNEDVESIKNSLYHLVCDYRSSTLPKINGDTAPYFFDKNVKLLLESCINSI